MANDYLAHCESCGFSYLVYTKKPNEVANMRMCVSCGKDISHQRPRTKFCSPKFAGEKQAHKCRNDNSNPRNNFKRHIGRIHERGQTLFDIMPYLKIA